MFHEIRRAPVTFRTLIMFHARSNKTMKDFAPLQNLIMFHEHEELQAAYYTIRENADK